MSTYDQPRGPLGVLPMGRTYQLYKAHTIIMVRLL